MNEEELKAAQAKLAEDTAALEAEKEKLKNADDTELQAQLKANATTIEALQTKLKAKKVVKKDDKVDNTFDVEKFKAEMASTVADLVTSGLTAANTANKEQELINKIKEVEEDFDPAGFTTVTLKKYHNAITKKAKVNPDTPSLNTRGIFQPMQEGEKDPMLIKSLEMRAEAAKKAKEGK